MYNGTVIFCTCLKIDLLSGSLFAYSKECVVSLNCYFLVDKPLARVTTFADGPVESSCFLFSIITFSPCLFLSRSSACDRPRTYDRYYQKTPLNYHKSFSSADTLHQAAAKYRNAHTPSAAVDSAISLCSSEEDTALLLQRQQEAGDGVDGNADGQMGDGDGTVESTMGPSQRKVKKSKKRRELTYSRTITERDVKHLERHLRYKSGFEPPALKSQKNVYGLLLFFSMKKTIRKKIMRDLQQAFVGDPKEFTKTEESQTISDAEKKKKEIDFLKNALNFDPKTQKKSGEQRFLDMLRDSSDDSGMGSPSR